MRIVAISDTHGMHRQITVPEGDMLIHAGDLTKHGAVDELDEFDQWLASLPHRHKVVIAGNHDFCFERQRPASEPKITAAVYLQDAATTIEGVRIYGSPWQPWFLNWAFNLQRGPELREKWDLIPDDTDVLITHGPPAGLLDVTDRGEGTGCRDLVDAIARVRPRLHVFGHIHEAYGTATDGTTTYLNASTCDLAYRPLNAALVFDMD